MIKAGMRMDGLVAVITGAAQGIGAETAALFVSLGARAVLLLDYHPSWKDLHFKVVTDSSGSEIISHWADITDEDAVEEAARYLEERFGSCDILVNNAGVLEFSELENTSLEAWKRTIESNLNGHFLCTRAFGRLMLEQGRGSIVNVTSLAASWPKAGAGAYSVSKAGQAMLARQVAVEWGPRGVRANVVSPGMIRTAMAGDLYKESDILRRRSEMVPVGRIGTSSDVSHAIAFLASDESNYITGQEIEIDGGVGQMLVRLLPHPGVVKDVSE